jgi:DeoR/GlpR family transcriptional regulator of sugar metabolism
MEEFERVDGQLEIAAEPLTSTEAVQVSKETDQLMRDLQAETEDSVVQRFEGIAVPDQFNTDKDSEQSNEEEQDEKQLQERIAKLMQA